MYTIRITKMLASFTDGTLSSPPGDAHVLWVTLLAKNIQELHGGAKTNKPPGLVFHTSDGGAGKSTSFKKNMQTI